MRKTTELYESDELLKPLIPPLQVNISQISILLIIAIWLAMVFLVNPIGDFPLNDDWAYGWTVKTLLETGSFQLSDWTATNLLPQALWGALFCLPFGFSFTALRISTLVLGLLGVLASYGLLKEVTSKDWLALLGALTIALNPVYFSLSNSFNNDISSFTFAILSLYFIVCGLKQDSRLITVVGILISFISILNRQSGIVILVAFGLTFLIKRGINVKNFILSGLPVVSGVVLHIGYSHWLSQHSGLPALYGFQVDNLLKTFSAGPVVVAATYLTNAIIMLVYLGLFLFPFLTVCVAVSFNNFSRKDRKLTLLIVLLLLATGVALILKRLQMPFVGNVLEPFGIGPTTLEGSFNSFGPRFRELSNYGWKLLTLVGFAGAGLLISYLVLAFKAMLNRQSKIIAENGWLLVLLTAVVVAYFALIGGLDKQYWFDRYLLLLMPVLLLLITVSNIDVLNKNLSFNLGAATVSFLLIYFAITTATTHDYLSSNRVRWLALTDLTNRQNVPIEKVYGGVEFNGWHFGNSLRTCNPEYQTAFVLEKVDWSTFTCLWGQNTRTFQYSYSLGFDKKADYTVEKTYMFKRWLPWKKQRLYVLKKI